MDVLTVSHPSFILGPRNLAVCLQAGPRKIGLHCYPLGRMCLKGASPSFSPTRTSPWQPSKAGKRIPRFPRLTGVCKHDCAPKAHVPAASVVDCAVRSASCLHALPWSGLELEFKSKGSNRKCEKGWGGAVTNPCLLLSPPFFCKC
jgi:hypothetical protein